MIKLVSLKSALFAISCILVYSFLTASVFGYICPSMIIVGIPCPACGLTRAGLMFFTGHFNESFDMHPLFIFVLILMVLYIKCLLLKKSTIRLRQAAIILLIISFPLFFARMILFFPKQEPLVINKNAIFIHLIHNENK